MADGVHHEYNKPKVDPPVNGRFQLSGSDVKISL